MLERRLNGGKLPPQGVVAEFESMRGRVGWAVALAVASCALQELPARGTRVPEALMGIWSGNVSASPLGPGLPGWLLGISSADAEGNVYMMHPSLSQLFRIQGDLAQYCFGYDAASQQPVTGADEAPFVVAPVDDEANEVKLCWRGRRLPSHAPNCTGCDCAVWTLKLDGDVLHSTFQMSPPAIHLSAALTRSGPAPAAAVLRRNWNCTFDNATQHPEHPLLPPGAAPRASNLSCPFLARAMTEQRPQQVAQPDALGRVSNCLVITSDKHHARLEYVAAKLPCMPCDVTFKFSVDTSFVESSSSSSSLRYVALGFKETYAA